MNYVTEQHGIVGTTTKYTSTDAAQSLTAPTNCIGAFITLETQPIRFGFGITPANDAGAALGHVMVADTVNNWLWLRTNKEVEAFKFISKVAGAHGVLHVTFYTGT